MSLSDVREFILRNRRRLLVGLVAVLGIILATGFLFREVVPEVSEEEKIPSFSLAQEPGSVVGAVDLSKLASADFPPSITVYRTGKKDLTFTQDESKTLAASFGFSQLSGEVDTPLGKIYVFAKTGEELTVTSNPRALHYTREGASGAGKLPTSVDAVQNARGFLTAKNLPDPGSVSPIVKYLSTLGERTTETVAEEARFVEVIFPWSVNGLDILGESPTDAAARLVFDSAGKLVYLTFKFSDYSFAVAQNIPLVSFTEATSVLGREAQVVLVRPTGVVKEWTLSGSSNLSSFAPESVRLVYVKQSQGDLLYPVYLFEGTGRTGGIDVKAAVYVLAVSSRYIKEE
uniref:Uncharacterized protein n=1 Tax=candidate division WWE3 bacterium TaxID=2053526 RepID=A0A831YSV8_UNCKA